MNIKNLRQVKFLSQEDLAELSNLSLRTIQRVESGHRVSYASLRALAAAFDINVDELEQGLYSMDKIINDYQAYPLWLRLYLGSGWFAASRHEFKKIEIFFLVAATVFGTAWCISASMDLAIQNIVMIGTLCSFFGAYNVSVSIRTGDKYDVWSKLEPTLPRGLFGLKKTR